MPEDTLPSHPELSPHTPSALPSPGSKEDTTWPGKQKDCSLLWEALLSPTAGWQGCPLCPPALGTCVCYYPFLSCCELLRSVTASVPASPSTRPALSTCQRMLVNELMHGGMNWGEEGMNL